MYQKIFQKIRPPPQTRAKQFKTVTGIILLSKIWQESTAMIAWHILPKKTGIVSCTRVLGEESQRNIQKVWTVHDAVQPPGILLTITRGEGGGALCLHYSCKLLFFGRRHQTKPKFKIQLSQPNTTQFNSTVLPFNFGKKLWNVIQACPVSQTFYFTLN